MNEEKRKRLEEKGFRVGTVAEFLELSPEEESIIETRLALSRAVKKRRLAMNLTQEAAAKRLHSSQSRIAKMEAGDKTVSLDLMVRNLFGLGVKAEELPDVLAEALEG